jgi:hypothetical protein
MSMSKGTLSLWMTMTTASLAVVSNVASATPFADALAIRKATGTDVEKVWGRGFGWGVGAGFLGGAIVGRALAAPYYRYGYGYPYPYPYYGPYVGYRYPYFNDSRGPYPYDRQLCCRY